MPDEIKTEAAKVETAVKADESKVSAELTAAKGWVETHWVWIAGLGGLIAGLVIGHFVHF